MSTSLRLCLHPSRSLTRTCVKLCQRRTIALSAFRHAEAEVTPATPVDENAAAAEESGPSSRARDDDDRAEVAFPTSYRTFLQTVGAPLQHVGSRPNYLGGTTPFPMNPSFTPPPPVSDVTRTLMWQMFMRDPVENNVRALSQRFRISMKRVDAILRLKGMEADWVKNKSLQTGYARGMDKVLGATTSQQIVDVAIEEKKKMVGELDEFQLKLFKDDIQIARDGSEDDKLRYVALSHQHEADTLEELEHRDDARQRYVRSYWESVPESGGEPVVPGVLEEVQNRAENYAKNSEVRKQNLLPRIPDTKFVKTPVEKRRVATKEGRPDVKFVDVGAKFLNVNDEMKRLANARRRQEFKAKKNASAA